MARTHVRAIQVEIPHNKANRDAITAKLTEHDTALDALETLSYGTSDFKQSCRFATTGNVNLATVGTTATDGVTPVAGDRVLVWKQSTASQNGIYVVGATAWTRATDADTSAEVTTGLTVYVSEGTLYGAKWFTLTTTGAITLASTGLTFQSVPVDLKSTTNGLGASLVGIEDASPGYFTATDVEAALREVKLIADACNAAIVKHASLSLNLAMLKALGATTSASVSFAAALPSDARVVGSEIVVVTTLAGSGLTTAVATLEATTDTAGALVNDADLTNTGGTILAGGNNPYASRGGQTLQLTFTLAGCNLADLTAGAVTANVFYNVLA